MTSDLDAQPGTLPTDAILVRTLEKADRDALVKIDKASMGRERGEYYDAKIRTALDEGRLQTSLVAELDDHVVGFLLAKLYYGEFGQADPVAVIDSVGVVPEYRGRHVGEALMRQLLMNLRALNVMRVDTQVDWEQHDLLRFLSRSGFAPASRFCLELRLD